MISRVPVRWWLLGLFILGLVARIGLVTKLGWSKPPVSDEIEIDSYAWNLAQGNGYRGISPDVRDADGQLLDHPTAYRVPLTSVIWAGLYKVFGRHVEVLRLFHCICGAITVLLVYWIGRHCFDQTVGALAAIVFAIYPIALLIPHALQAESISTMCFMAYVLASLQFADKPTWSQALWAGLLLGLSLLSRASTLFMLPLAGAWALWQFRGRWNVMLRGAAIPVIAALTLAPWAVRNYRVFGKFIPLSTQGGSALLQGNNRIVVEDPKYYGYCIWDTRIPEYREALQSANDEIERDRRAMQFATEWIKSNSDKWWYLIQAKFRRSWTPFLQAESPALYRYGMLLSWGPVVFVFVLAFFPTLIGFLRHNHPCWLLHLAIMHYTINSLIFFGLFRYRYSIEGLCIVIATAAVVWLWRRVKAR